MTPPIAPGYVTHVENQVTKNAAVSKAAGGTGPGLVVKSGVNTAQAIREGIYGSQKYSPPPGIDFALLSKKAYGRNYQERMVDGYDIIPKYTSEDRVVYRHQASGHVIVAFRGTDFHDVHTVSGAQFRRNPIKALSHEFETRHFRDVTTDAALALGLQGAVSHRFYNSTRVTRQVIDEYGLRNVSVTGHSLGGSQAMHVSNLLNVHAEAYNPHISWNDALTHSNFFHSTVHVNYTDPISTFFPGIRAEKIDARYNKKAKPFMGQHGIDNFILPASKKSKFEIPATSKSKSDQTRIQPRIVPVASHPSGQYTHYGGGQNLTPLTMDCAHMSHYQKVVHGCPTRVRATA